jgi:transmembrane sensor
LLLVSAAAFQAARPDPMHYTTTTATAVGKFKRVTLPDGSLLTLNTDSAVEVAFDPAARHVRLLRGEAYFKVAHAPERPFRVEAAQVHVQAVGTAFNVRYHAKKVEVTVTEGRVALNDATGFALTLASPAEELAAAPSPPAAETVAAGARATVALTVTGAPAMGPVNVSRLLAPAVDSALAWQSGRLEFSETPLAEVVSEFNRYNRHQIVIEDAELATQRFGGAFACNGYASFIEVLERSFSVVADRRGGSTVLRRR